MSTARGNVLSALSTLPLEYVNETVELHPEWIVDKITPRRVLSITTYNDLLMPVEESLALYAKAGEPMDSRPPLLAGDRWDDSDPG